MFNLKNSINEIKTQLNEKAKFFIEASTAIINAGGEGVRLRPYTLTQPKPLLKIGLNPKPLMYWAMLPLLLSGVSKFIITVRYGKEAIEEEFGKGENLSKEFNRAIKVDYVEEPKPLGRAGCIKLGLEKGKINTSKPAIILNASDILAINFLDLAKHHIWQRIAYEFEVTQVYALGYKVQYGIGKIHPTTGQVLEFIEKPERLEPINTACYCLQERLNDFKYIKKIPSNPEDDLIHEWVRKGIVGSYIIPYEKIISIKFEADLEKANKTDLEKFIKANEA
jgi:NDP-sugar pyrophosphorylase family protein